MEDNHIPIEATMTNIELSSNTNRDLNKEKDAYLKVCTEEQITDAIPPNTQHNQIEAQIANQSIRLFQFKTIGNCYSFLYTSKGFPLIVIGPDWMVYLMLSSCISIGTYGFLWFFNTYLDKYIKFICIFLYTVFMFSYSFLALVNPGFPGYGSYIKALDEELTYCSGCKIYLPLSKGYKHCSECNLCIEGRDHHCQWTSKCIGKRNMKAFYAFCMSIFCLILCFIISLITIQNNYLKSHSKLL